MNYYTILGIGGDIKTLRNLERVAEDAWADLIEQCNQVAPDDDRVVRAAEAYALAAHDCDCQKTVINNVVNRLDLDNDCKQAVAQMTRGPHDGTKARAIYHTLANLMAVTDAESADSWDNLFDGAIDWLRDGAKITYKTTDEVAAAKSKARAAMRALVLDSTL